MKEYQCTELQALKDLSRHEMKIIHDDGIHRHIRFKRPESSSYWFDIITYPGALVIDGDMGTYVFRRLDDMFEFFRTDAKYLQGDGLKINPGYWGEKITATANYGGFKEFSEQALRVRVKEAFDSYVQDHPEGEEEFDYDCLWDDIENEVLTAETEDEVHLVLRDFDFLGFSFPETWEWDLTEYTFHYIWNCYAIAWAIQRYDAPKSEVAP